MSQSLAVENPGAELEVVIEVIPFLVKLTIQFCLFSTKAKKVRKRKTFE